MTHPHFEPGDADEPCTWRAPKIPPRRRLPFVLYLGAIGFLLWVLWDLTLKLFS